MSSVRYLQQDLSKRFATETWVCETCVDGCELAEFNPLNAELNPICHLLALGAHHILHVGRIRVNAVAVDKG